MSAPVDWRTILPGKMCPDAEEWLAQFRSPAIAWRQCKRGDWMLWQASNSPRVRRQSLVLAACECARTKLHLVPEGEERPRIAIETAEAWCRGEATIEQVRAAAAAYDAAFAYEAAYDAYAAAAAADAYAAAYAAAAVREQAHADCARIVRRHIRWQDVVVEVTP